MVYGYRHIPKAAAACLLPVLAGCASFAGVPEPVIATDDVVAIARTAPYQIGRAHV